LLTSWNAATCKKLRQPLESDFDVAELWDRVRSRHGNGSPLYKPIKFFGPRPRPIASEKPRRARGKRLRPSERRVVKKPLPDAVFDAMLLHRKVSDSLSNM
jgi:hypothetical protein